MGDESLKESGSIATVIKEIVNKVYDGFILNDLLSKIVPGLILIHSLNYIFNGILIKLIAWPNFDWPVLISLAWATGFTLQSFGESVGIIASWPRDHYNPLNEERSKIKGWSTILGFIKNERRIGHWYNDYFAFCKQGYHEKTYLIRFATILNIVNNLSFSVFSSTLLLIGSRYLDSSVHSSDMDRLALLLFVLSFLSLVLGTRVHRDRLFRCVKKNE